MGAAREMGQADFDLERFIDMFDEALTSNDERVVNALRSLMMMVILTKPEVRNPMGDRNQGPLRQLVNDVNVLNRRMRDMEETLREIQDFRYKKEAYQWDDLQKYKLDVMNQAQSIDPAFQKHLQSALNQINGGYHQTNAVSKTRVPK